MSARRKAEGSMRTMKQRCAFAKHSQFLINSARGNASGKERETDIGKLGEEDEDERAFETSDMKT